MTTMEKNCSQCGMCNAQDKAMIRERDAYYAMLDDPKQSCGWRDIGPDEIWEAAWKAAGELEGVCDNGD